MALKVRFNSAAEVRRTLQRVSNAVLTGDLDTKTANSITNAANTALRAIETGEQNKKLAELELILTEVSKNTKKYR